MQALTRPEALVAAPFNGIYITTLFIYHMGKFVVLIL